MSLTLPACPELPPPAPPSRRLGGIPRRFRRPLGKTPERAPRLPGRCPLEAASIKHPEATRPERVDLTPRLLGVEDAAHYLSISGWSLREWISAGVVPTVRIALPSTGRRKGDTCRRILLDRYDLDSLIERSKERSS